MISHRQLTQAEMDRCDAWTKSINWFPKDASEITFMYALWGAAIDSVTPPTDDQVERVARALAEIIEDDDRKWDWPAHIEEAKAAIEEAKAAIAAMQAAPAPSADDCGDAEAHRRDEGVARKLS